MGNESTERPIERQVLYAKSRLSLAKMYIRDLENKIPSIPKGQWIQSIEKIFDECEPVIPVETAAMRDRAAPFLPVKAPPVQAETTLATPAAAPADTAPANVFRGQAVE